MRHRRTRSIWAMAVAVLHLCAIDPWHAAFAQDTSKRIASLDLIPVGVADGIARATTELVRRAVGRNPRYRLAPAPLRLRPMLLALGCPKLDLSCLGKIGKQLGVDQILFGELVRQPGVGDRLTLQVFDVASAQILRSEAREIPDPPGSPSYARALEDTTHLALGDQLRLDVESNVEGAIILVNGQPVGTTPFSVTDGLRPGTNTVIVRRPGHDDFKVIVDVRPGKAQKLRAELRKKGEAPTLVGPVKPPEPKPPVVTGQPATTTTTTTRDDKPIYKKWWFWTIIGVAVLGGTTAGIAAASGGGQRSPTVGVEF